MTLLLDTSILIDFHSENRRQSGKEGPATRFMEENPSQTVVISPVSASEYAAGVRSERESRRFLKRFRLIPFGRDLALFAGRLDRELSAKGIRLGENDTWQAAMAMAFDLTLVSADRDFARVPALKLRNYNR